MFKKDYEKHSKFNGWTKLVLIILPIVLIFVGTSAFFVNSWYNDNLKPLSSEQDSDDVIVVIEEGASVREIGDQLKSLGVIRNSTVFAWYVGRQDFKSSLQAGTYRFNPTQSVEDIVTALVAGDVATNLFTILPGRRLDQLEKSLVDFGFSDEEVSNAINAKYDHPLFSTVPSNASLEGYIFPDTYQITVGMTAADIVERSFDELYSKLTPDFLAQLKSQKLTLHEAITLASIIEQESGNVEDQKSIAQVFLTRLKKGMQLGSDVTFFYAAAITGEEPSPDLDSPYNTRMYEGLPPGPIGNFNFTALEAVANPADTDYLYFVAGDNGTTYFSKTLEEHERLVEQYCIELCQL